MPGLDVAGPRLDLRNVGARVPVESQRGALTF